MSFADTIADDHGIPASDFGETVTLTLPGGAAQTVADAIGLPLNRRDLSMLGGQVTGLERTWLIPVANVTGEIVGGTRILQSGGAAWRATDIIDRGAHGVWRIITKKER